MSNAEKRPYSQAVVVANALVQVLGPVCHRVEIAGSLRRQKEMIGDIEIVAIPKMHTDLFGEPLETSEVDDLLAGLPIILSKDGPKYKAFSFEWQAGWTFHVDLFLQPDPQTFGVNMLLRTGSADFSHRFVTPKAFGGFKPDGIEVKDARLWRNGAALATPEEQDVFRVYEMAFVEPQDRN